MDVICNSTPNQSPFKLRIYFKRYFYTLLFRQINNFHTHIQVNFIVKLEQITYIKKGDLIRIMALFPERQIFIGQIDAGVVVWEDENWIFTFVLEQITDIKTRDLIRIIAWIPESRNFIGQI